MELIKIGEDPYLKKPIHKLLFKTEKPKLQIFNDSDITIGHPSSNLAIAFTYTWKDDFAPKYIQEIFQRFSNYAYLTGHWRTTNGARYAFSNILANPNVNKLFVLTFDKADNGHHLVDALTNFWKHGVDKDGIIINSKAQNPKFEQLPKKALERIRQQCDLVVIGNITEKDVDKLEYILKNAINEPKNPVKLSNYPELGIQFISHTVAEDLLYDDGARFTEPMHIDLSQTGEQVTFSEKQISKTLGQGIQAQNLQDALESLAAFVFQNGSMLNDDRNITIAECRSLSITILDPLEKIPKSYTRQYIKDYVDEFMKGPKSQDMDYNYHERIFKRWGDQPARAIAMLKKHNPSRRMVISLWDQRTDIENPCAPCLDLIWVVIRNNKLEMHVLFRSHHLATVSKDGKLLPGEGAFVPNVYALATLQESMAKQLNIGRGPFVVNDMSGHLYVAKK